MDKFVVGFPKSGTVSVAECLQCGRYEYAYNDDGLEVFLKKHPNHQPIFVLRDPVERTWSAYRYFNAFKTMTIKQFMEIEHASDPRLGINNPKKAADYWKYIKPWLPYKPIILKLETIKNKIPWKNSGDKFRPMNGEERAYLNTVLNSEILKYQEIPETPFF